MFYNLLLAHLLADYPFQSKWIIANKLRWSVLGVHAAIHFLASLLLLWPVVRLAWPYVLLLAAIHFLLDLAKNAVNRGRPDWIVLPYVVDQACHLISIAIIARLIEAQVGAGAMPAGPVWVILGIAYLLVTYVWYITERILAHGDAGYRTASLDGYWVRMVFRAGLLTLILLVWIWISDSAAVVSAMALVPYSSRIYGRRAASIDIAVPAVVSLLVMLAL